MNDRQLIARRHFLDQCRIGLGGMAHGFALGRWKRPGFRCRELGSERSAGGSAHAFPAQGQERHLPVHGRRAEPARAVRPQAEAAGARRPADPRSRVAKGKRFAFIKGDAKLLGTRAQVRQARPVRRWSSASCCRTSATIVDDIVHRPQR